MIRVLQESGAKCKTEAHIDTVYTGDFSSTHVVFRNHVRPKNAEFPSNQVLSQSSVNEKVNIFSLYTYNYILNNFNTRF